MRGNEEAERIRNQKRAIKKAERARKERERLERQVERDMKEAAKARKQAERREKIKKFVENFSLICAFLIALGIVGAMVVSLFSDQVTFAGIMSWFMDAIGWWLIIAIGGTLILCLVGLAFLYILPWIAIAAGIVGVIFLARAYYVAGIILIIIAVSIRIFFSRWG